MDQFEKKMLYFWGASVCLGLLDVEGYCVRRAIGYGELVGAVG